MKNTPARIRLVNWSSDDGPPGEIKYRSLLRPGKVTREVLSTREERKWPGRNAAKPIAVWRSCVQIAALAENCGLRTALCLLPRWEIPGPRPTEGRAYFQMPSVRGSYTTHQPFVQFEENNRAVFALLDYPLAHAVRVQIAPLANVRDRRKTMHMDAQYLLWMLAHEYVRIYRHFRKHGVWGHRLTDLYFEGMQLYGDGRLEVYVGS